ADRMAQHLGIRPEWRHEATRGNFQRAAGAQRVIGQCGVEILQRFRDGGRETEQGEVAEEHGESREWEIVNGESEELAFGSEMRGFYDSRFPVLDSRPSSQA